jgi:poly(ribitol-phosphate) beta-N-acetylglucosaminyltransferase
VARGLRPAASALKVSVVVPVYNPGRQIDALLESLRRQSLPSDEFEALFVDDGSTDGTAERLDTLAAEVSNFRVLHVPRSGWPGRPRNVGIAAARGRFIQFADNDDELGVEALERLYRFATKNGSDVVVGREIRAGRRFPYGLRLFAQNHARMAPDDARLLSSLSPHKLFRRQFLLDRDIRFPEAPRIFEDYAFVMEAYLVAEVISVLSDYPCYHWRLREHKRSAGEGSRGRSYEHTIAAIHRRTEPGPLRDRLLAHWYQRRVLDFADRRWAEDPTPRAERRFRTWCADAERYFPVEVDPLLPGVMRVRSALLRAGDLEKLRALSGRRVRLCRGESALEWRRRSATVRVDGWVCLADRAPVETQAIDGRLRWRPPVDLGDAVPPELLDFTADLDDLRFEVLARRRGSGDTLPLPGLSRALAGDGRLGGRTTARIGGSPRRERARALYPGKWDLFTELSVAGWHVRAPLRSDPAGTSPDRPVRAGGRSIRIWTTRHGTLALTVEPDRPLRRWAALLPRPVRRLAGRARRKLLAAG